MEIVRVLVKMKTKDIQRLDYMDSSEDDRISRCTRLPIRYGKLLWPRWEGAWLG